VSKKKGVLRKIMEFLWKNIHSFILLIGSGLLLFFGTRDYLEKRKIKRIKWKKIPGTKIKVQVLNEKKEWEEVKLPVVNEIQLTTDDISTIRKTEKEGEYAAKIKHKIKDRRNIAFSGDGNSSMDI